MLVLHVNWADGGLRLWAESVDAHPGDPIGPVARAAGALTAGGGEVATLAPPAAHPFAVPSARLAGSLVDAGLLDRASLGRPAPMQLSLPYDASGPRASDRLADLLAQVGRPEGDRLGRFEIPTVGLANDLALAALLHLEDRGPSERIHFAHSLRYWFAVARFVLELLADQRFIPTLIQSPAAPEKLRAAWKPWLNDETAQARLGALLAAMPPIVRAAGAAVDDEDQPWAILHEAVSALCDATVRRALGDAEYIEAIQDRDSAADPQVAWLAGLLGQADGVSLNGEAAPSARDAAAALLGDVRSWLARLDAAAQTRPFRLCLRLAEPEPGAPAEERAGDDDLAEPAAWQLSLHLLLEGDPPVMVDTARVWSSSPSALLIDGHRIERPHDLLLTELGRASRVYPRLESALAGTHPDSIELSTAEAAEFLQEYREVLEESGFSVQVPEWWDRPSSRLGLRLHIESPELNDLEGGGAGAGPTGALLGLDSLVRYTWRIAVGDQPLTAQQLRDIATAGRLVRIGGRWVQNPAEDLAEARDMVKRESGGELTLRQAIRMAQGSQDGRAGGLPVLGMDADGWVGRVFGLDASPGSQEPLPLPRLAQPQTFHGKLRAYQQTGLSWLAFLERFGLGACLADDMGLGKTIQLIALLLHERDGEARVGPTLLVVPTSLIANWQRELERFAPSLRAHVHHGPQRRGGRDFAELLPEFDIVITTYALVPRDRETLGPVQWRRVVLDEAQYIKNPPTRQTTAIRQLHAERRVALTGTPVENRLSELWSIMEFCNPGYLGTADEFRRRCAVPIERHRDRQRAESLRNLVRPFILRRLKSDPNVIVDLPPCVETKEFATLTTEQAALYQATVDELLTLVDEAEGIQRRGRVLAALTRLKQVCNHPANLSDAVRAAAGAAPAPLDDHASLSARSGKCRRLMGLLEELLAVGDRALVFTQYRRMGDLLAAMIRADLDCDVQFMHGGTPPPKRQEMIDRFQSGDPAVPIFILSLKTGGVGLNLTAANHVFHFDRWWNPAVEKQATDRAFRIGQTRTVQVHKFVCAGTLEERIDQMIEQKTELAENVISSGEKWMTELSTQKLAEILQLRASAMEVEP